ncbi:MAG TPA: DUF3566 domain-containing protein [Ilumatobacteraceae bacterium]
MDSGVPQASNRGGSRAGGGGVQPPPTKGGAAKTNGTVPRTGPVDPRTEDSNGAGGVPRAGKTIWRRPGMLTPRTAKHRETAGVDGPIEFSVATPLAPAPLDPPDGLVTEPEVAVTPSALAPTTLVPTEDAPIDPPTVPMSMPGPILYDEAATIDDVTKIGPVLDKRPLLRPVHFRRAPKPRVRRVTRVVRHVDTWSVFKVALVFNVFFYAVAMVAGVLLWQVAYATGTVDNVEKFFEGFGWESFKFNGGQIFHNAWIAGLFVAVGLTGLAVLLATMFNLITDLVGGVRLSVLEEEVRTRAERGTERAVVVTAPQQVVTQSVTDTAADEDEQPIDAPDSPDEAIAG